MLSFLYELEIEHNMQNCLKDLPVGLPGVASSFPPLRSKGTNRGLCNKYSTVGEAEILGFESE